MFLCTYILLKTSSCVTFSVFFATRASIVCIDSGTCDTIRVSLALAIRFFDISINRYTPTNQSPFLVYISTAVHDMLNKYGDFTNLCFTSSLEILRKLTGTYLRT